ncbi:hypothetical protein ACVXHA_15855 [Escherichia coli]
MQAIIQKAGTASYLSAFDCGVTIMRTITIINPNVKFYIRMICREMELKALSVEKGLARRG